MSVTHASISPAPLVAQPANFSDQEPHTHRPTKGLGQALKPWAKSQSPSTPRAGGAGGARHGPTILNQQTPTPPTSPHPNTPALWPCYLLLLPAPPHHPTCLMAMSLRSRRLRTMVTVPKPPFPRGRMASMCALQGGPAVA